MPERTGWGFLALFMTAQIAAYLSFLPLLVILLPLKAAEIGGADKASTLALVTICGSAMAFFANPVAGAISDRTRSRWGRRRPWILVGSLGTVAAYAAIALATSPIQLAGAFMFFQLAFNTLFAPLNAVVPDRIPDEQKGLVSGLIGLGPPIGSIIGVTLIGQVIADMPTRFIAIGTILFAGILPFVVLARERVAPSPHDAVLTRRRIWDFRIDPREHPDFVITWIARFLVMVPYSLVTGYALYYLQDAVGYAKVFPDSKPEQGLALLTAISTAAAALSTFGGGLLSDRLNRRKMFVATAGTTMALAIAIIAIFPTWPGLILGFALFGLGAGCFFAVDVALIAQVLPPGGDAGKYLGVMNMTNIFGQAIAPAMAVQVLAASGNNYPLLFGIAAVIALIGAVSVQPIRNVR